MVFSCFAVYVLANNTRVVPYFESCMAPLGPYPFKNRFSKETCKEDFHHNYVLVVEGLFLILGPFT